MASKMGLSVRPSQPNEISLGMLHGRLLLDHPKRIHYGSEDPVTGNVTVRFERQPGKAPNTELFGPLEVDVTLKGIIRMVSSNSSISDSSPQNEQVFIKKTVNLHTGSFRAEPGTEHEFPFSINFPEHADAKHKTSVSAYQDADGNWKFRQRLSDTTIDDLPPSLGSREKYSIVKSDMAIRYSVSLKVHMPGIDIKIINPSAIEREVLYDRPRVPAIAATMQSDQTTSFKQQLSVEHKSLAPPESRSSGLKSIFKSSGPLPKYVLDVKCTSVPQHIFIGQPINFTISLSTDWDKTTAAASDTPKVSLNSCTVSLLAHTRGKKSVYSNSSDEPYNVEILKEKTCEVTGLSLSTPGDVDVGTLSAVPSTFSHEDISREYKLKLVMSFSVLGQTRNVARMVEVTVHPPLLEDVAGVDADDVAGSEGGDENLSPLPTYESAVGDGATTPSYFDR